jgi:hypothetical protein
MRLARDRPEVRGAGSAGPQRAPRSQLVSNVRAQGVAREAEVAKSAAVLVLTTPGLDVIVTAARDPSATCGPVAKAPGCLRDLRPFGTSRRRACSHLLVSNLQASSKDPH